MIKELFKGLNQKGIYTIKNTRQRNCDGAIEVGIENKFLMCRNKWVYWYSKLRVKNHIVVRNFYEIEKHLSCN